VLKKIQKGKELMTQTKTKAVSQVKLDMTNSKAFQEMISILETIQEYKADIKTLSTQFNNMLIQIGINKAEIEQTTTFSAPYSRKDLIAKLTNVKTNDLPKIHEALIKVGFVNGLDEFKKSSKRVEFDYA
jgi:predicted phage-related endonuclease